MSLINVYRLTVSDGAINENDMRKAVGRDLVSEFSRTSSLEGKQQLVFCSEAAAARLMSKRHALGIESMEKDVDRTLRLQLSRGYHLISPMTLRYHT